MDFIDRTLEDAPFSSKHILNFLHNGPPEDRLTDMPNFDWRDVFNLTDRVIRMLNQYGDVSGHYSNLLMQSNTNDWILVNVHISMEN